jgi:amino acid transporter
MLLPSVAISIAIHYFGADLTLVPNDTIVLIAVFAPAVLLGVALGISGMTATTR